MVSGHSKPFGYDTKPQLNEKFVKLNTPKVGHKAQRFHSPKDFFFAWLREQTFINFDSVHVDKHELARVGFISVHNDDLVQCVYCNGILGLWSKADDIKKEHRKYYSNCPNINGDMTNISDIEESQTLQKLLEDKLSQRPSKKLKFSAGE